ncbi:MAG: AAA family ATPase, partial [Clostridia bacterium]|nr:AAA family ATPase [Clostridia bacterium]
IKGLLNIFGSLGLRVAMAAPTGRAAKRMSEATSSEAKTVHRLLETVRGEGSVPTFGRDRNDPLEEDVVILDDSSMLDLPLAEALLDALKRGSRLVMVGDADQLPSVGPGNVFGDLLASGVLNTVRLDEIFRQSETSLIVTNAHKINLGEMPVLSAKDNDFFFLPRREDEIAGTVVDLMARRLPRAYGESILEQLQIITPSRKGSNGTEALNVLLQGALNPKSATAEEIAFRERTFREGDRVMQVRNNYSVEWVENPMNAEGVFNGDIGVIEKIGADGEYLTVRYDGARLARYDRSMYEELEHAYAITVHKSQGSEYGTVILPLYACPPMLRTRNLLYTAITRARQRVILVGREDILSSMVENNRHFLRYTHLSERLCAAFSEAGGSR